jgi:hypothetical protein
LARVVCPVFAVAAADNAGGRCSFAASGPEVDLWAPGCPQDVALSDGRAAWASGSSESTSFTAAVLAQLRGFDPSLTPEQAEAYLTSSGLGQGAGKGLDADAAFRAAGLAAALAEARRTAPSFSVPADSAASPSGETAGMLAAPSPESTAVPSTWPTGIAARPVTPRPYGARLPKPLVRAVRFEGSRVSLECMNRPAGIVAAVRVFSRKRSGAFPTLVRSLRLKDDRLRTRVSGTVTEVSMTYVDPAERRGMSAPLSVRR